MEGMYGAVYSLLSWIAGRGFINHDRINYRILAISIFALFIDSIFEILMLLLLVVHHFYIATFDFVFHFRHLYISGCVFS